MTITRAVGIALLLGLAACGSGNGDASDVDDAVGLDAAPGLDVPEHTWTWVPVPGAVCANGSTTGFAVNLSSSSADLLVYFEGGGACFNAETCFQLDAAVRIDEDVDQADFEALRPGLEAASILSRTDANNAFADATFVFVPYCTGDVHAGDATQVYDDDGTPRTVNHKGGHNTQLFIDLLHQTLPEVTQVWDMGSSAGGFGATFNHHRFVDAWPAAQVDLLADCAPLLPIVTNTYADYPQWQSNWNLDLPAPCPGCTTDFPSVIDAVSANNPSSRIALLAYDEDPVIKLFFGYATLAPTLMSFIDDHYVGANMHSFVLSAATHVMFGGYDTLAQPGGGISLQAWIQQWAHGDAGWMSAP